MILYLGASSLIKLYIKELNSDVLRDWTRAAEIVATSRIAYTEVMSALDMRFKKGDILKDDYNLIVESFFNDWQHFARIDFDDYEAGNFVNKYGLTRFGALHLSSAKLIQRTYLKLKSDYEVQNKGQFNITFFFSSADEALTKAAIAEGLRVLPL